MYSLLLGNGDGSFQITIPIPVNDIESFAVGDFNGDGKLDLLLNPVQYETPGAFYTMLGNGNGKFGEAVNATLFQADASKLLVGDFNGDGKLDVAVGGYPNSFSVLLGNGDGTFQALTPISLNEETLCGEVGDFNQDRKLDLLACANNDVGIGVLLGKGDGTFQAPTTLAPLTFGPVDIAVADLNGDGKLDLIAVASTGSVAILPGNGDGTFQPAVTYPVGSEPLSQAMIGDFNADGKLDLALPGTTNLYILFGNGDGTLQAPQAFVAQAGLGAVGDFIQARTPDIAMNTYANDGSLNVAILLQQTPKSDFSPLSLAFGSEIVNSSSSPPENHPHQRWLLRAGHRVDTDWRRLLPD